MSTQDLKLFDLLDGLEMTKSQYEWLAHRFENMTAKEALLFRGAMQIEQPQATCDVMQIANQLEHYELLYGAGNDFALGNFVMEHIFYPSSQTREFLDPAKVGAAYRQKDGNTFCDGNFIRLSSPLDLSQNSDPAMLPDRGDYGIRVKLASRNNMEGIWVGFPDTSEYMDSSHPDELLLALDALEAETLTECIAVDVDCCLPQLRDILSQYDSAAELIRHAIDFGYVWAEQGQGEPRWLDKWQAVMELEDCHQLDYALDLAQNLHCYNFMPRDMEVMVYFKEIRRADEKLSGKRDEIESELPRFVATITQELANSRDVLSMVEHYKQNAGATFAAELDILTADMRSGSYEAALTRFEARFNSPLLSDVVRGLIGVLRGDDGVHYFQMLAHDMKQLELQRLKAKAMKIPPKIRVFSFILLMCFLVTYLAIIIFQILNSLSGMF